MVFLFSESQVKELTVGQIKGTDGRLGKYYHEMLNVMSMEAL